MEQSRSSHVITEQEKQVCKILLNLHYLVNKSKFSTSSSSTSSGWLPVWGAKGRRSAIDLPPSPPHNSRPDKKPKTTDYGDYSSPATPLSFPVTESDHNTHKQLPRFKLAKKKLTIEELLETVKELVQTRELLTKELEKVKNFHNGQKAFNEVLKAKQQEVQFHAREPNSEPSKSLNLVTDLSQNVNPFSNSLLLENHQINHHHFLTLVQQQQNNYIFQYPCNQTPPLSAKDSHVSPHGLPDLNASVFDAGHLQPLDHNILAFEDDSRAIAAEARKRRMVRVRQRRINLAPIKTSRC